MQLVTHSKVVPPSKVNAIQCIGWIRFLKLSHTVLSNLSTVSPMVSHEGALVHSWFQGGLSTYPLSSPPSFSCSSARVSFWFGGLLSERWKKQLIVIQPRGMLYLIRRVYVISQSPRSTSESNGMSHKIWSDEHCDRQLGRRTCQTARWWGCLPRQTVFHPDPTTIRIWQATEDFFSSERS